jgi:serine/threonine protein phosphatase 1
VELFEYFSTRKNALVLMGNHERKHLNGVLTYAQEIVKVQFGEKYPAFLDWLKTLEYYYETAAAIIVHAFFEHDKSLAKQKETVLSGSTSGTRYLEQKYGTDKYWSEFYDGEKPIIYGHHVVGEAVKVLNNTFGIDTGACHGGMLTAIELPNFKIHQIKVEQDYWQTERVKWQIPVLKAKSWKTMTFEQIQRQIDKLRYIENTEIQAFLDEKENWSLAIQAKIPTLLALLKIKADSILAEYGNKQFNTIANQFPYKVSLFKVRANNLTIDDLRKQLKSYDKVQKLEKELTS